MIVHTMPQRTPEWFEVKRGKIGGTSAGAGKETLIMQILSEITEDFTDEEQGYQNAAMMRGTELEPYAREAISAELFIDFQEVGYLQSSSIPIIGISPDGISPDHKVQIEIKCPGAKKHIQTLLEGNIPLDNLDQCIHAFVVNDQLEKLYFVSYRPESNVKQLWYKELTLDSEVNAGTKAKPKMMTVRDIVDIKRQEYEEINMEVNKAVNKLIGMLP